MSRPRSAGRLHGFVVIDKPASWTSHDVVGWARRVFGERRIGHAGTLDPAATGVLPLAVGQATRLVEYLSDADKAYRATIRFGVTTDSLDGDGRVVAAMNPSALTRHRVEAELAHWLGPIEQVPPMYSAIKIGGERLYEAARRGEEVERASRSIRIDALELVGWEPPDADVIVRCSKGTYVRTLAADIGAALGTGAHLTDLVRLQTGPFWLDEAWTLSEVIERWEDAGDACWPAIAHHPDAVIQHWPSLVLSGEGLQRWLHGMEVAADPVTGYSKTTGSAGGQTPVTGCRAYDPNGTFLGTGTEAGDGLIWRPAKVFQPAGPGVGGDDI
ncbi:MAG: tRNA pseudouridine(55) synthase TruB [Thermomicrobiales bacterium]